MLQACSEELTRISQEPFKGIGKKKFKSVPLKFLGCFKEVLFSKFVAWHSLQLPEQEEGLLHYMQ